MIYASTTTPTARSVRRPIGDRPVYAIERPAKTRAIVVLRAPSDPWEHVDPLLPIPAGSA